MTYRVALDVFDGPLDLLLYLVRRNELEINDLPLGRITRQYLEFVEVLEVIDFDEVGEFIVMASTLLELKSRSVLPQPADAPPEMVEVADDPRADLVRQLLEYKRFKEAAGLLESQASEWQTRYPRLSDDAPRISNNPAEDLIREVELWDLVAALTRVLKANTEAAPASIVYDDTPISTYIEQIRARVLAEHRVAFSALFAGAAFRSKIVGIFLAILELLRHYGFRAEQPCDYGDIWILPPNSDSTHHPPPLQLITD